MKRAVSRRLAAAIIVALIWTLVFPIAASPPPMKLTFTAPVEGASLPEKRIPVKASFVARSGPASVDFLVNGTLRETARMVIGREGSGSVSFLWDTLLLSAGKYVLTLVVHTKSGEQTSARVTVELTGPRAAAQPPQIEFPLDGSTVSGKIEVRVNANEADGSNVVLLVDGRLRAISNVAPYSFQLEAAELAQGTHALQARVYRSGGEFVSSRVTAVQVGEPSLAAVAAAPSATREAPTVSRSQTTNFSPSLSAGEALSESPQAGVPRTAGQSMSTPPVGEARVATTPSAKQPSRAQAAAKHDAWKMSLTSGPRSSAAPSAPATAASPAPTSSPTPALTSSAGREYAWLPGTVQRTATESYRPRMEGPALALPTAAAQRTPALSTRPEQPAARAAAPTAPVVKARPAKLQAPAIRLHTVVQGDCLWTIARKYGSSVKQIVEANALSNADRIQIGDRLWIPSGPTLAVNGRSVAAHPGPFFKDGRLMIPLRTIFEACGGEVIWESKSDRVVINISGTELILGVGATRGLLGGTEVELGGQVMLHAGRTFIPLAALREVAALPARFELEENRLEVARVPR